MSLHPRRFLRHARRTALFAALIMASGHVCAAEPLSEDRATEAAVAFIRGDTYGESRIDIASHLTDVQIVTNGRNDCGTITAPVWAFHFQSTLQGQRINGWLNLDAMSGDVTCSSIPFLRVGG